MNKSLFVAVFLIMPVLAFAQTSATPSTTGSASVSSQKIDPEKQKLIRDVLERTKEVEMAQERLEQAYVAMKQMMSRLPEKYWEKYRSLITADEIRSRLTEVYDRHYSTDELKSMLAFYDTPAGKKMTENAVPILRDSMSIAQDMSRRASKDVMSEATSEQLLQNPISAGSFNGMLLNSRTSPTPAEGSPTPASTSGAAP